MCYVAMKYQTNDLSCHIEYSSKMRYYVMNNQKYFRIGDLLSFRTICSCIVKSESPSEIVFFLLANCKYERRAMEIRTKKSNAYRRLSTLKEKSKSTNQKTKEKAIMLLRRYVTSMTNYFLHLIVKLPPHISSYPYSKYLPQPNSQTHYPLSNMCFVQLYIYTILSLSQK